MQTEVKREDEVLSSLRDQLEKIAENEKFITFDINIKQLATEGASYTGELFAVDIIGKTINGDKELNLFVKKLVEAAEENIKDMGSLSEIYEREGFCYTSLAKIFTELQDEANIPDEERFIMVKGYAESTSKALILQNISKLGFKTGFRMDLITFEYAKLALEQLARLHAFSFVIEKRRPLFFEEHIKNILPLFAFNDAGIRNMTNLMSSTASNLKNFELKKKAEEFVPDALEKFQRYYMVDKTPVEVLCHGDYRMNNTLFKVTDGVVTEVIPVDYQTVYYGCPIHDIVYLIYTGTDRQFREKHLDELIDIYYNAVDRFLRYFDMDIRDHWPRNVFDKMFEERRDMGLMTSMMVMGFLLVNDDDIIDFATKKMEDWKPSMHECFQERFGDIVAEFL